MTERAPRTRTLAMFILFFAVTAPAPRTRQRTGR